MSFTNPIQIVAATLGQLRLPSRRDWPIVLSVGLVQMAAFMALTTFALQFVAAGRSAILAYTTPLWLVPIAALLAALLAKGRKGSVD